MSKTAFKKLIVRFNETLSPCLQRDLLDEAIILAYYLPIKHKSFAVSQIKGYWCKISGSCNSFWLNWYNNQVNHLEPRDLPATIQTPLESPDFVEPQTNSESFLNHF